MAMIDGYCEKKYRIMGGSIVFPWTDEREDLCEYILRADREVADKITHLAEIIAREYEINFSHLPLFNLKRAKQCLKIQRRVIYYDVITKRIIREHEELENLYL